MLVEPIPRRIYMIDESKLQSCTAGQASIKMYMHKLKFNWLLQ